MTGLADHLRERGAGGRKLLVPYLMAGIPDRDAFPEALRAVAEHGDAVEIGLPYSDPLMDGPVIAAAGERAINGGVGPLGALDLVAETRIDPPKIVMTYYNPIHRAGEGAFCRRAAAAGVRGLIVPDLPLEESEGLRHEAASCGLAWIPLVAPTSSPARVERIAATATGFLYAVSTMGVTGARSELSLCAREVADRCKAATDLPVLVGIGVSTPAQAVAASASADGVVVGSAVVAAVLEGGAAAAQALLKEMRSALDA
ncbi:MAG: tryptophan synthase subunit alpha [Actinomycetota bacterium]|nr:tryptophan synthase subunit alpha [Actinomycetota bacterium]